MAILEGTASILAAAWGSRLSHSEAQSAAASALRGSQWNLRSREGG
jgi:hypothetical protein